MRTAFFLAYFILTLIVCGQAHGISLDDLYRAAVKNTSAVKTYRIEESMAQEKKRQALAEVRPQLSLSSNSIWRDQVDVGAFGEGYQHSAYVTLSQSLFQGGAEYALLKVAKSLPSLAQWQRRQAEIDLYTDVAIAFFSVLKLKREQEAFKEQEATLQDRVKTLQRRAQIGRNKSTDVLAAQTQLARVTAEIARLEGQFVAARQKLVRLTGLPELDELQDDTSLAQLQVTPLSEERLANNPQLKIMELLIANTKREVKAAQAKHLPSLDLDTNYYFDRAGILKGSQWEVTINASWNIYSGGGDEAQISLKKLEQEKLTAQQVDLQRNITSEFTALKDELLANKQAVEKLRKAVELAERNYKQHIRESNQGLVSPLDALRVLEDYLQTRRLFDQQIYASKIAWVRLRALVGDLP